MALPFIKSVEPKPDYHLLISFTDGKRVLYNVMEDIQQIPAYQDLLNIEGLFERVHTDASRTCVFWNDEIDLPSDTLYKFGQPVE